MSNLQTGKGKRNKELRQKLAREESKLDRAVQTGTREDILDCLGSLRGALELCIAQYERKAGIVPNGSLHERILLLEEKHQLTPDQASDAHRIRMITNEAVHFYGNAQDRTTHKYLEHLDKKGLADLAREVFSTVERLAAASQQVQTNLPPKEMSRNTKPQVEMSKKTVPSEETSQKTEPSEKDSAKKDPYLVIFMGILAIAFICLLLSKFLQ